MIWINCLRFVSARPRVAQPDRRAIFRVGRACSSVRIEPRDISKVGRGVPRVLDHLTIGSSDRGSCCFGEPRRGSMIGINELRSMSAQPRSQLRFRAP
jgi:hypothetical protein